MGHGPTSYPMDSPSINEAFFATISTYNATDHTTHIGKAATYPVIGSIHFAIIHDTTPLSLRSVLVLEPAIHIMYICAHRLP